MIPERYRTGDQNTFANYTAHTRWPLIIQDAIANFEKELERHTGESSKQGETIKSQLKEILREVESDAKLRPFTEHEVEVAHVPTSFNEHLNDPRNAGDSWFNAEWLFTEVYMYRRINVLFRLQPLWTEFDVFERAKQSAFRSSFHGVLELALRYQVLSAQLGQHGKDERDEEALRLLFKEFIDISLWGNATDLSLLRNVSLEDIKSLQSSAARKNAESRILIDDSPKAWQVLLENGPNSRVDFILDNSGFELYADLVFAAFLIRSNLAKQCIFHVKDIPYMVSDALFKDFNLLLDDMKSNDFFPSERLVEASTRSALDKFTGDIKEILSTGQLEFHTSPFWTSDLDFWNIQPSETEHGGAEVYKSLSESDLVIFKGDLNYRKLTGDRKWSRTTPWSEAIGPLATSEITLLSLRTCKADVQVGLPEGVNEKLCEEWGRTFPDRSTWWTCSGKWAVISFHSH